MTETRPKNTQETHQFEDNLKDVVDRNPPDL